MDTKNNMYKTNKILILKTSANPQASFRNSLADRIVMTGLVAKIIFWSPCKE